MIVDALTYVWDHPKQMGQMWRMFRAPSAGLFVPDLPVVTVEDGFSAPVATSAHHREACEHADYAFVVRFKSHDLQAEVSFESVRVYLEQHPEKLIGVACVDPTRPGEAMSDLRLAQSTRRFAAIAVAPPAQNFHPAGSLACRIYEKVHELSWPLWILMGIGCSSSSRMEYADPILLDEVARNFPELKIIVSGLGDVGLDNLLVLLGKHENVYADISGVIGQSWLRYHALLRAYEYGVMHKLLFASAFPFATTTMAVEAVYNTNQLCQGTSLPPIPREALRSIVERPTLEILGFTKPKAPPMPVPSNTLIHDDLLN